MPWTGPAPYVAYSAVSSSPNIAVLIAKRRSACLAGSLAVLGDAVHSSVDAVYNVLGLIVVRVASREPDDEHPYDTASSKRSARWQSSSSSQSRALSWYAAPSVVSCLVVIRCR